MKERKTKNKKRCQLTSIGGQAVLEGVMMQSASSRAIAVRDADGIIRIETKRFDKEKNKKISKIPLVRGIVAFVKSLFGGTEVLMRSAEVYGEGEPSKFEKWLSRKLKIDVMSVVGFISVIVGLGLAILLFMWLPQFLRGLLEKAFGVKFGVWAKNFTEGGIKLLIFTGYLLFASLLKDIRRTFMYHGAEHKTITCYESGMELSVENAKKCRRVHDRCGTTFIVFVLFISIILFAVFESLIGTSLNGIIRVLCKILFLPLVAGLSYELLKLLSKTDSPLFFPLKAPGLLLQRITTREPDDKMLEVAIAAFNKVMELDADESIAVSTFVAPEKRKKLVERIYTELKSAGIDERAEAEWIVSLTLNIPRSQVNTGDTVSVSDVGKVNAIVKMRLTGRPLWYCIGNTDFYGYNIKVDERVLIPRPETEELVSNALGYIKEDSCVLDLCTGSGAIAIAVKLKTNATVYASDVNTDAISLARENAVENGADIEFVVSDLFDGLRDLKFDVIITNPPYIKTDVVKSLQKEVKDFEPILALDGGVDGLDFYRRIAKDSMTFLKDNGVILMECGYDQAASVKDIFAEHGYKNIEIIKDMENKERIVKAVINV